MKSSIKSIFNENNLTEGTDLSQLALLPRLHGTQTASWPRPRPSTLLLSSCRVAAFLLRGLLRQIVNELVQRENAEADFVVARFGAALKQAGEGHSRR